MYDSNYHGAERGSRARTSHRSRRRRGLTGQPWFYGVLLVILAVLIVVAMVLGLKSCNSTSDSIEGRWDLDGATAYEFNADGKGALVLTTMTFEFQYTVNGNTVTIDFADDRASDAKYEFAIADDLLMLTGGPDNAQSQHILKRVK